MRRPRRFRAVVAFFFAALMLSSAIVLSYHNLLGLQLFHHGSSHAHTPHRNDSQHIDGVVRRLNTTEDDGTSTHLQGRATPRLNIYQLAPITVEKYNEKVCLGSTLLRNMHDPQPFVLEQARFVSTCDPLMESFGWRKTPTRVLNLPYLSNVLNGLDIPVPIQQQRQPNGRFGDCVDLRWTHIAPYQDPSTGVWKEVSLQMVSSSNKGKC